MVSGYNSVHVCFAGRWWAIPQSQVLAGEGSDYFFGPMLKLLVGYFPAIFASTFWCVDAVLAAQVDDTFWLGFSQWSSAGEGFLKQNRWVARLEQFHYSVIRPILWFCAPRQAMFLDYAGSRCTCRYWIEFIDFVSLQKLTTFCLFRQFCSVLRGQTTIRKNTA